MPQTYYDVLGVGLKSTTAEIRSAYRKLVLQHHPDRSKDPKSKAIFLAATEAYETLGDLQRRKDYDARLAIQQHLKAKGKQPSTTQQSVPKQAPRPGPQQHPSSRMAAIKDDVARLSSIFSRGRYDEAEKLAQNIIERDARQPVPYAVLGDIARLRGNRKEALKMYAYAAQFEPHNPVYQRRYEEFLGANPIATSTSTKSDEKSSQFFAPMFGLGLILLACIYVVLSRENPVFPSLKLISTWTVGLIVMLFFSGVVLGACLALDGLIDSFSSVSTNALGRVSPSVALASIAIVNFWVAIAMYIGIGLRRQAFNFSTTRVLAISAAGTCILALAAEASGGLSGAQVFMWGGNLVYLGALCGWMVSDALRSGSGSSV